MNHRYKSKTTGDVVEAVQVSVLAIKTMIGRGIRPVSWPNWARELLFFKCRQAHLGPDTYIHSFTRSFGGHHTMIGEGDWIVRRESCVLARFSDDYFWRTYESAGGGENPMNSPEISFRTGFHAMSDLTFAVHESKGWTEGVDPKEPNWNAAQHALMHSELSEALEALRKDLNDDKLTHRKGVEVELADCVIRIMNYARQTGLDVAGALIEKNRYNATREHRHGGKKF